MIFIGVALLVSIGLALLIGADAGSLLGLTQEQTARLVPLLAILVIFAAGLFIHTRRFSELVGNILLWTGIFGLTALGYTYRNEISAMATRVMGELQPGVAMIDIELRTATFRRDRGGHFEIQATVNGHTIPMIFDTGASAVVLTIDDAKAAGIDTRRLRYTVPVSTANGTGRAARIRLNLIEVGGITRRNIIAFIADHGALETSLLGMTFLETLSRYAVTQNALELVD